MGEMCELRVREFRKLAQFCVLINILPDYKVTRFRLKFVAWYSCYSQAGM